MEIWKDVVGYEGLYEVSNMGRIRSCDRCVKGRNGCLRKIKGKILKPKKDHNGRLRIDLSKDGKYEYRKVHRIVALAFLEKIENKEEVNHIDGNCENNELSNLEWVNRKENVNHAFDSGLMTTAYEVVLVNKENGEEKKFRSMISASRFLGKSDRYLNNKYNRKQYETEDYKIIFKGEKNE